MFTGIIEAVGEIIAVQDVEGGRRLQIAAPATLLEGVKIGDSIAVDGACLTVVGLSAAASAETAPAEQEAAGAPSFDVDVVLSTLERTVAGSYGPGSAVNLERAMVLGARLDGHMVQGHVDGMGHLVSVRDEGTTRFIEVQIPAEIWAQTLLHGSIALNGISLTVNALRSPDRVEIAIIPHTWAETNLARLTAGAALNVEGDLLGKYVSRMLAAQGVLPGATSTD